MPEMDHLTAAPTADDLHRAGWIVLPPDDGFIGTIGPFRRHRAEPHRFGFLAEKRHDNINGVVQGGMLMSFADRCLGYLAFEAAGARCATVAFSTDFISGGRIGSFVELAGEVMRTSRSLVFLRGVLSGEGRIVATCQGTWKILGR